MIRFEKDRSCLWFPADAGASTGGGEEPAILFLHGIGERGFGSDDLALVAKWGLPKFRAEGRRLLESPFSVPRRGTAMPSRPHVVRS